MKCYTDRHEQLARIARALSHPARVSICSFLAKERECSFNQLAEELPLSKATIVQHLAALRDAGLVLAEPDESRKVRYVLSLEAWERTKVLFTEFVRYDILCEEQEDWFKEQ